MTSEEKPEPDAWKFKLRSGVEYVNDYAKHTDTVEDEREPLWSAETFQEQVDDLISHFWIKMDAADSQETEETVQELIGKLNELQEVFSDEQ